MSFKSLLRSAIALTALIIVSVSAQASLVFQFSITNTIGTVGGTVTGTIYGLSDNSTGAASDVTIDTLPAGMSSIYPVGSIDAALWDQQLQNSFTVSGGAIVAAEFWAQNSFNGFLQGSQLYIDGGEGPYNFVNVDGTDTHYVWGDNGPQGVAFTQISANDVPEPGSVALVALGLLGSLLVRRRRAD